MEAATKHVAIFAEGRMKAFGLLMEEEGEIQTILHTIPPILLAEIARESDGNPKVRYCLDASCDPFSAEVSVLVVFENPTTVIHVLGMDLDDEDEVVAVGVLEWDSIQFAEIDESSLIA